MTWSSASVSQFAPDVLPPSSQSWKQWKTVIAAVQSMSWKRFSKTRKEEESTKAYSEQRNNERNITNSNLKFSIELRIWSNNMFVFFLPELLEDGLFGSPICLLHFVKSGGVCILHKAVIIWPRITIHPVEINQVISADFWLCYILFNNKRFYKHKLIHTDPANLLKIIMRARIIFTWREDKDLIDTYKL